MTLLRLLLVLFFLSPVLLIGEGKQKTVVFTFDDSVKSQATFVAPLLKTNGFSGTFFITEGFSFHTKKDLYMTWEEIKALHDQGFEIGNHTKSHRSAAKMTKDELNASLDHIEKQCEKHGIPRPVTFCYPMYRTSDRAVEVLKARGYQFARAGGNKVSEPGKDNPLLLPQAFDSKPNTTFEQFKAAVDKADDSHIPIITFHGVPDIEHPWVNTDQDRFVKYVEYLKSENFNVIALRDYPLNK